jgi:hypothetical protein
MMDKMRNSVQFALRKLGKLIDLTTQSRLAAGFAARGELSPGRFEDRS